MSIHCSRTTPRQIKKQILGPDPMENYETNIFCGWVLKTLQQKTSANFFSHIYDTKNAQETSWWRFFLVLRGHSYVSLQPIRKPWRKFFFGLTWTYRIVHFYFSRKVYRITYKKMGNIGIDIKLKYLYLKFWKKTLKRLFVQFLSCFSFRDHHN